MNRDAREDRRVAAAGDGDREEIGDVVAGGEDAAAAGQQHGADARRRARPSSNAPISASYIAPVMAFFFSRPGERDAGTAPSR